MQTVSNSYKESISKSMRNRAYIRAYLGVINSKAQQNITADNGKNDLTYYSNSYEPLFGELPEKIYATAEQNFSFLDGSMYFLPKKESGFDFYNNGIVAKNMCGSVIFTFKEFSGLDIKGVTIDFGECYPSEFIIQNDNTERIYQNNKRVFQTEDTFDETSFLKITAVKMVNGEGRLRIYQFSTGIVKVFGNKEVKNFSQTEYVSSITDTIPSLDISITVDNQNLYYNPDLSESALSYLEVGQQMSVAFGYDVTGDGNIEWLPETTAYLKDWSANYIEASFSATDKFDLIESVYSRGVYSENGISLYSLAEDVFEDMGIEAENYYIDPYLQDIIINNPIPNVKHTEALQIIANAGRCALYTGRNNKTYIKSSFVPDVYPSCNGETAYSNINSILDIKDKDAYGIASNNFTPVNGNVFFMPRNSNYLYTGYISEQICDENGFFNEEPVITLNLETAFPIFSFYIRFRESAPKEFKIRNYLKDELVEEIRVENPDIIYHQTEQMKMSDRIEIVFTTGKPNTRITVDCISLSDIITDYYITSSNMTKDYDAVRLQKTKSINIKKNNYRKGSEKKDISSGEATIDEYNTYVSVYFSNASSPETVMVENNSSITAEIVEFSSYMAIIKFNNVSQKTIVKYVITGTEYTVDQSDYLVTHNQSGNEIVWNNPLVSNDEQAEKIEEWLANYYLSDVEYDITWRGDPRVDANDLFYLETKTGIRPMIRSYQNSINFNGAFDGSMKARKVVF